MNLLFLFHLAVVDQSSKGISPETHHDDGMASMHCMFILSSFVVLLAGAFLLGRAFKGGNKNKLNDQDPNTQA